MRLGAAGNCLNDSRGISGGDGELITLKTHRSCFNVLFAIVASLSGVAADDGLPLTLDHELAGKLVLIPAGGFLMGSPSTATAVNANERPQHQVNIDSPFYIGACEVTYGRFKQFVGATN